jgi:hypothetical protein
MFGDGHEAVAAQIHVLSVIAPSFFPAAHERSDDIG